MVYYTYMALYVKQNQSRSELQERIAAELQEKARKKAEPADKPDGVEDSRYIEGTKRTTGLALAWLLIGIAIVGVTLWLIIISTQAAKY